MKTLLNEEINYKVERAKNGVLVAYIDPNTSENTYGFKDVIKKYGAKWDSFAKRWFWWLSNDKNESDRIIKTKIHPAIEELTKLETPRFGGERRNSDDIKEEVDKMVRELDNILEAPVVESQSNSLSEQEIKNRVSTFKEKIVNITSSEEFKTVMGPIVKFKQAQGHSYSFSNIILIWLQDRKATMVKSRGRWAEVNRRVKEGAPAILLYKPVGLEPYTEEEKREITIEFLKLFGAKSVKDLTPGQKEKLSVKLSGKNPKGYKLVPNFFDHRFTEPIEGKEDLAPNANTDNIEWFDDKSPSSNKTIALYDSAIKSIEEVGIKVVYKTDLEGARGVSTSGKIEVLKGTNKNIGDFSTLVHEFSHELLHQNFLKNKNRTKYGAFFVGTKQGRAQVEQQAELSAWIICQYFGYDMPTSVNYMGCWGMDEKSAANVFDIVADTSSKIIELITKNLKNLNENMSLNEGIISGEMIANLVGLGDLYKKSKRMQMEEPIREMIRTAIVDILSEAREKDNDFNYTHFAVNKNTGLIVNGWDYRGYDSKELKDFKRDYFLQDLIDNGFNPNDFKILIKRNCLKQGINPDDKENYWSNRGEIPLKYERK